MKITKTQLRNLIKEEIGKVVEEQKLDEFFGPFKKKKPSYDEKMYDAWEALDHQDKVAALRQEPIEGLTVPGLRITDDTYPYNYIPAEVRDAWEDDQKIIDAEKRNARTRRDRRLTPDELARQKEKKDKEARYFASQGKKKKKPRRIRGMDMGGGTPGYIADPDRDDDRWDE